ncbi:16S rRNA processing protein RimM [bacterium]|jgi:16S rRNA processing protein RimM|nr:16S rRNA processing protein RimM [bacterium]
MEYINLGKIINTRGLKGELKLLSFSDFVSERYQKGSKIYFYNEELDLRESFTVSKYTVSGDFIYLQVLEIQDVETAKKYKDFLVQFPTEALPKLDGDHYYYYELINCEVSFEDGEKIGLVLAVENYGAQAILRVQGSEKQYLIPFVASYLVKVDIEQKRIIIKRIEGLL